MGIPRAMRPVLCYLHSKGIEILSIEVDGEKQVNYQEEYHLDAGIDDDAKS